MKDYLKPINPFIFIPAVALMTLLFAVIFANAYPSDAKIAHAIYHAENSHKYPYGIKSIPTFGNKEYARQICLNSIRNARRRWELSGRRGDFICFLSRRYCPRKEHRLNKNWVRNVKFYL